MNRQRVCIDSTCVMGKIKITCVTGRRNLQRKGCSIPWRRSQSRHMSRKKDNEGRDDVIYNEHIALVETLSNPHDWSCKRRKEMQTVFVRLYGIMNAGVMMKQRFEEYLGDIRTSHGSKICGGRKRPFSTLFNIMPPVLKSSCSSKSQCTMMNSGQMVNYEAIYLNFTVIRN